MLADAAHNEALFRKRQDVDSRLVEISDALEHAALPTPATLEQVSSLLGQVERVARIWKAIGRGSNGVASTWRGQLTRAAQHIESVQAHGLPLGCRATYAANPKWPDDPDVVPPCNPVEIVGIVVETRRAWFGNQLETSHERKIIDARGREWQISVERLTAL